MKTIIDLSKNPEECCPSWERCQVNDCPLARKPNKYKTLPEDKLLFNYHKCRCKKYARMKIAKAFKLKSLGLTLRELSAMRQRIRMKKEFFSTQRKKVETSQMTLKIEGGEEKA